MFNVGGPSSQTFCGEQRSPNFCERANPPNHHEPDSPQFPPEERSAMSKNKKQKARREAKDNHRKKAQQTIPVAANKPLAPPRATKSPISKLYGSKTNPTAKKPKQTPNTPPQSAPPTPKAKKAPIVEKAKVQAGQKHEVPFGVYDRILLVGEGDFSFAHSLCLEHGCANVTATSFDSAEDVEVKYVYPLPMRPNSGSPTTVPRAYTRADTPSSRR
jgi:hypothetical protein